MMKNKFRRSVLVSSSIVLASFAVFSVGLYFASNNLSKEAEQVVINKDLLGRRTRILESLAELKRAAAEAELYQAQMDLLLPTQDQLIDFPRWLEGLARVHGAKVAFAFKGGGAEPTERSAGFTPFTLRVEGTYGNIVEFLKEFEIQSQRFLLTLEGVELVRSGNIHQFSTEGRVFFK